MARYSSTKILKQATKKRRFATTIYPNIPVSADDVYIRTTSPERLDNLAFQFYKDVDLWWIIAQANEIGKGTLIVPQDTLLRIPSSDNITDLLKQVNNNR
tara:strand:- start:115 stop:414 length:300 start_codon:yes stop_codon:yes gene_type:complete